MHIQSTAFILSRLDGCEHGGGPRLESINLGYCWLSNQQAAVAYFTVFRPCRHRLLATRVAGLRCSMWGPQRVAATACLAIQAV